MRGNIQHFMNFTDIILSPAALKSRGKHSTFHELYWHYPITSCKTVRTALFGLKPAAWTNPLHTQKITNPFSKFISLKALPSERSKKKIFLKMEKRRGKKLAERSTDQRGSWRWPCCPPTARSRRTGSRPWPWTCRSCLPSAPSPCGWCPWSSPAPSPTCWTLPPASLSRSLKQDGVTWLVMETAS